MKQNARHYDTRDYPNKDNATSSEDKACIQTKILTTYYFIIKLADKGFVIFTIDKQVFIEEARRQLSNKMFCMAKLWIVFIFISKADTF